MLVIVVRSLTEKTMLLLLHRDIGLCSWYTQLVFVFWIIENLFMYGNRISLLLQLCNVLWRKFNNLKCWSAYSLNTSCGIYYFSFKILINAEGYLTIWYFDSSSIILSINCPVLRNTLTTELHYFNQWVWNLKTASNRTLFDGRSS